MNIIANLVNRLENALRNPGNLRKVHIVGRLYLAKVGPVPLIPCWRCDSNEIAVKRNLVLLVSELLVWSTVVEVAVVIAVLKLI